MATKEPGVWGIDLGQCALKAVRLQLIDGKVTATNFDYIEHPKILSQPDADPDQLAREALETFLSRNDLKGDAVAIAVPGQSGLARFVKLPPVEEKKIGDIVRFEAKQQIPFPLEEVIWDYQKIGQGTVEGGFALETEIGLFAMKKDMVSRALQQFTDVHIEVTTIQMAPLALCNFVAFDLLKKNKGKAKAEGGDEGGGKGKECVVALDIGAESSNLVITDGERVIWQRPIPIGGNRFTRDLTRELKLTFAKAEHVKRNAAKSADLRKILLALRPGLNEFVNEVQRSLGYFTNTHRGVTITYLVGLGNAFRLPGLQKFLQEKLQLEVRKLSKMERLHGDDVITQPQFSENVPSFAVAYGLALQGLDLTLIHTNLLPKEIRTERLIRAKKPWAVATAAALLLGVPACYLGMGFEYASYTNKQVTEASAQGESAYKEAKGILDEYESYMSQVRNSEETVKQIAAGVDERFNWSLVYKYIAECVPRPDPNNSRVPIDSSLAGSFKPRQNYVDEDARTAYKAWLQQQAAVQSFSTSEKEDKKRDQFIKQHLVQINIEGINCLYAEDLKPFFETVQKNSPDLLGLSRKEKENVQGKANLPTKGWVFEVRGYTYWKQKPESDPKQFIIRTLIENLRYPDSQGADIPLTEDMKKRVANKLSYVVLYKYDFVDNPGPALTLAGQSRLRDVVEGTGGAKGGGPPGGYPNYPPGGGGGGGYSKDSGAPGEPVQPPGQSGSGQTTGSSGPDRSAWTPLGEIASAVLGGAKAGDSKGGPAPSGTAGGAGGDSGAIEPGRDIGGRPRPSSTGKGDGPPRTEFIIFFIWNEPTLDGGSESPSPTEPTQAAS